MSKYMYEYTKMPPYLPMPRFLLNCPISNTAKMLYVRLLGKAQLSQKNHWLDRQGRFNRMVGRYNDIYRVQMPNITPHVCRHTYCSNMARSGMNPKTLQYLIGHSDISVTMNVYTHISFDDAEEELKRMEEFRKAQAEIEKKNDAKAVSQKMFKVV